MVRLPCNSNWFNNTVTQKDFSDQPLLEINFNFVLPIFKIETADEEEERTKRSSKLLILRALCAPQTDQSMYRYRTTPPEKLLSKQGKIKKISRSFLKLTTNFFIPKYIAIFDPQSVFVFGLDEWPKFSLLKIIPPQQSLHPSDRIVFNTFFLLILSFNKQKKNNVNDPLIFFQFVRDTFFETK